MKVYLLKEDTQPWSYFYRIVWTKRGQVWALPLCGKNYKTDDGIKTTYALNVNQIYCIKNTQENYYLTIESQIRGLKLMTTM